MGVRVYCFLGLALFAALSAADFALTYRLIQGGDGAVYESNPVAAAWLERFGWPGLAAFKAAAALVVATTVVVLAPRSPRASAGVVTLACLALVLVVSYSGRLHAETMLGDDVIIEEFGPIRPADPARTHPAARAHWRLPDLPRHGS